MTPGSSISRRKADTKEWLTLHGDSIEHILKGKPSTSIAIDSAIA